MSYERPLTVEKQVVLSKEMSWLCTSQH